MCVSECGHVLKVCEHDILKPLAGNFAKYTTRVQLGAEINGLGFEVRSSKIKVTVRQMWSERNCGNFEGHGLRGQGHRQPFQ